MQGSLTLCPETVALGEDQIPRECTQYRERASGWGEGVSKSIEIGIVRRNPRTLEDILLRGWALMSFAAQGFCFQGILKQNEGVWRQEECELRLRRWK